MCERGLVRFDNQDSFFISDERSIFCVADGMGGGSAGALASNIICEELGLFLNNNQDDIKLILEEAINSANERIRKYAKDNGFKQMGSTVVALAFDDDDESRADICHIGDSRVYRMRSGVVELMTEDHTLSNQILRSSGGLYFEQLKERRSPLSHILTRSVGCSDNVIPEWTSIDVCPGDWFLVCSDGVHDVVGKELMSNLFKSVKSIEEFSGRLKEEIYSHGALDNLTYIIIENKETL